MSIIITENAAKEVCRIIREQELGENTMLRVAVQGGGCSGFSYALGFDDEKTETDILTQQHNLTIVVDELSEGFLTGTTIDFRDELTKRGFTFANPLAAKSCGCGSSFNPKDKQDLLPSDTGGCGGCSNCG